MKFSLPLKALFVSCLFGFLPTGHGADWKKAIESAASGSVVEVPEGKFPASGIVVPEGVTVSGAGFNKTVIDAAGAVNGIVLSSGSTLQGLTITNAKGVGVQVKDSANVAIRNVRVSGSLTGLLAADVSSLLVENAIFDNNRTGVVFTNTKGSTLVNCTLFNNSSLALSQTSTSGSTIFNTLIVNSAMGAFLKDNADLKMDHNLYVANYVGKLYGQVPRVSVPGWSSLTGGDVRSLQMPVEFQDPAAGDFAIKSRLPWDDGVPVGVGFGVSQLGDVKAPATDALGRPWTAPSLGAIATPVDQAAQADGRIQVLRDGATVSASLFTPQGEMVANIFQNMRLPKNEKGYSFNLPSHDWQGRPIPAGTYEVRVAESAVRMEYQGLVFNTARSSHIRDHDTYHAQYAVFLPDGTLIIGNGWSESHLQVRSFDASYEKAGWSIYGGSAANGMALDGEGHLYFLSDVGKVEGSEDHKFSLKKFRTTDGSILPISDSAASPVFTGLFGKETDGLAVLDGRIFVSDPGNNRIRHTPVSQPTFKDEISLPSPRQIVADRKNNLLWVISGTNDVVALHPDGRVAHTHNFPHRVNRLAAANGRLAVLSSETGQIQIFEVASAQKLNALRTLGSGRDAFGKFEPNSFTFKERGNVSGVGLGDNGEVFVIDHPRTMLFDASGKLVRQTISAWGQHLVQGKLSGDDQPRWWNVESAYSMTMDSKAGTWAPDGLWKFPPQPGLNLFRRTVDFFHDGKRNFVMIHGNWQDPRYTIIEFDNYRGRTVAVWMPDPKNQDGILQQTDSNKDGIIDAKDAPPVALASSEKANWKSALANEVPTLDPDTNDLLFTGSIYGLPDTFGRRVRFKGLDASGIPTYDWANVEILKATMPPAETGAYISPFDLKTPEQLNNGVGEFAFFRDGTVAFGTRTKTGGGIGLGQSAGSDLAAVGPDGKFRWFVSLPLTAGIHGIQVVDDLLVTQDFTDMDWFVFNKDGLGLGVSGVPENMEWTGMWNDHHRQYRLFRGNDGETYAVLGDYMVTGFHLFKLTGRDTIRTWKIPVTITPERATRMAALPARPTPVSFAPPQFEFTIPKVDKDLPMDGDLKKWRAAGIDPVILITPETASGGISGPEDHSAVVRLAHRDGNLYVQVLKFDDVVTMHQPLTKHYQQDSVELCLNGFLSGFKFNVMRSIEHGETVFRDRFGHPEKNRVFTSEEVPRSIRVLDNAEEVTERSLIEPIYGIDLSGAKVVVTEFKLPLDLVFKDDPEAGSKGRSGDHIWLGMMLNDNDIPGSDSTGLITYPATYNTFSAKEAGAKATFE